MIVVDAHEDIAWNILTFQRDYTRSVVETRADETGTPVPSNNGHTLLGWPEWVRGRVALVFATLFAAPVRRQKGSWDTQCYQGPEEAYRLYRGQLDCYHRLVEEQPEKFNLLRNGAELEAHLDRWEAVPEEEVPGDAAPPIGMVILMEGAEGVLQPPELEEWYEAGVRLLGPAWAATRYSGGTGEPGGLTAEGHHLLEVMGDLGIALDLSHMAEEALFQAIDRYPGVVFASHSNVRSLLPESAYPDRHLSDRAIESIAEREGVIGVVPFNGFLKGDWRPEHGRQEVSIEHLVAHIDHICQLTGSSGSVGIGSDFDGGFGLDAIPLGLDNVGDLALIGNPLLKRGYDNEDVKAILGGNWLRVLRRSFLGEGL